MDDVPAGAKPVRTIPRPSDAKTPVADQMRRSPLNLRSYDDTAEGIPFWITVEGPIGAGKSELMKILVPQLEATYRGEGSVMVVPENIEIMMDRGTFQRSQQDPTRYTFQAQCMWFHRRTRDWLDAWNSGGSTARVIISERSVFSDPIFMATTFRKGYVQPHELSDYMELHSMWAEIYPIMPGLIIYCRAGETHDEIVDLCDKRIKERAREAETDLVDKEYNRLVLEEHEKRFGLSSGHARVGVGKDKEVIPVLIMDTTANYRDDVRVAKQKSDEVLGKVRLHMSGGSHQSEEEEIIVPRIQRKTPEAVGLE